MLCEGEASPAKTSWTADNTFVRSRFIVKRLKRMRSKTISLYDESEGSFCYQPQPLSLPYDVNNSSTDSLDSENFLCCSPDVKADENKNELDYKVKDLVDISLRNRYRIKEEDIDFQEETVQSLSSKNSSPQRLDEGKAEKDHNGNTKASDLEEPPQTEQEPFLYDFQKDEMNLLEELEAALPKKYSLKRHLFCLYSEVMYRAELRLNKIVAYPKNQKPTTISTIDEIEELSVSKELMRLEVELVVQQMLLEQTKKASNLSSLARYHLPQQLEAEKALLLAHVKFDAVQREMQKLRLMSSTDTLLGEESGFASITEITVTAEKPSAWNSYHLLVVAVERDNVRGSELETGLRDGQLRFTTPLHFHKLRPDFTLKIYLYGISLKDPKLRFFQRSTEGLAFMHKSKNYNHRRRNSEVNGHNFTLMGCAEVQLSHINNTEIVLHTTQKMSQSLAIRVKGDVYLNAHHSGFLSIRCCSEVEEVTKEQSTWDRLWWRLTGLELHGWAYPTQQQSEMPMINFSLKHAISSSVAPVDRFICVRPHTFQLPMKNSTILCCADTEEEMLLWCQQINKAIKAAQAWNYQ